MYFEIKAIIIRVVKNNGREYKLKSGYKDINNRKKDNIINNFLFC